jgi:hypothetical protein
MDLMRMACVMLGVNMDEVVANSDVESMAGVNLSMTRQANSYAAIRARAHF